ncbi:TRAP transporter small permease subunit [Polycyclovorans algicola]|uniref:TRAP transporter small permease subunit n=1 Tax=Polycyclovorans algicola TaxID=616992 RepID=UPI0005B78507|nr:TRAP transporter small permease subunit [Polycyclovorans algicola]
MASRIVAFIDAVNGRLYRLAGLLTLALTVLVFTIVVLRYAANTGSTALQEAALYLHALIFMLAVAHALPRGEHVRVDVFSARLGERAKRHIELFGTLVFLLPFAMFLLAISWDYVGRAWAIKERSSEPGGLPILFLLKTMILVMAGQLILQGIAEILRLTHAGKPT